MSGNKDASARIKINQLLQEAGCVTGEIVQLRKRTMDPMAPGRE